MLRSDQHEVGGGLTDFRAGDHQPEVVWLGVLAALLQAVVHRRLETDPVAVQTLIYTFFQLRIHNHILMKSVDELDLRFTFEKS